MKKNTMKSSFCSVILTPQVDFEYLREWKKQRKNMREQGFRIFLLNIGESAEITGFRSNRHVNGKNLSCLLRRISRGEIAARDICPYLCHIGSGEYTLPPLARADSPDTYPASLWRSLFYLLTELSAKSREPTTLLISCRTVFKPIIRELLPLVDEITLLSENKISRVPPSVRRPELRPITERRNHVYR